MTEIFRPAFIQAAADKVIDRHEWQALRTLKSQLKPGSEDAKLAAATLKIRDSYKSFVCLNHPILVEGKVSYSDFAVRPNYSANEWGPGKTLHLLDTGFDEALK